MVFPWHWFLKLENGTRGILALPRDLHFQGNKTQSLVINSFWKSLLSIYCMPDTVLRLGYTMEKKTNITLPSREHSPVEERGKKSHMNNCMCMCVCVAQLLQSCPTLCDAMDCCLTDSSVHGILQAKILEWVAMPSSRVSSQPRDWSHVSCISCIAGRFFTHWSTWEISIAVEGNIRWERAEESPWNLKDKKWGELESNRWSSTDET